MILKLYRGHDPLTIIVITLTGLLIWIRPLINPLAPVDFYGADSMPLYKLLEAVVGKSYFAGTLVSFLLVIVISLYLVNFNTRIFFINERTFLPASLFIIFSGFFRGLQALNPVLPSALLIIIAVDRIIGSYRKQGIAYNFFDASLLIGVASLFYFNSIWFFLVVVAGIILLRTVSLRELFLSIIGLATPYLVLLSWYYLNNTGFTGLAGTIASNLVSELPRHEWSHAQVITSLINVIAIIIALIHLWSVFNTKKVRSRKTFTLLLWVLLISVLVYLLVPAVTVVMFYILLLPVSYLLTHYMVYKDNKKMANILFAIAFISVVVLQFV